MNSRLTLAAVTAAASLFLSANAHAQAKSNIQDDPNSSSCTENCVDAGYSWAEANTPANADECNAANADFADGCKHWVQEQADAAAPPPMDDSAAPPPDDSSAPPPDDSAAPPPEDDSAAPPPDDSQAPPPEDDNSAPPPSNG